MKSKEPKGTKYDAKMIRKGKPKAAKWSQKGGKLKPKKRKKLTIPWRNLALYFLHAYYMLKFNSSD